jgi:hypothetical protein
LQVGPAPNQNFEFFVRVKLRHPFPTGISQSFSPDPVTGQWDSNFFPCTLTPHLSGGGAVDGVAITNGGQGYAPSSSFPIYFDPPLGTLTGGSPVNYGWLANSNANGNITSITIGTNGGSYTALPYAYAAAQSTQQVMMPDSWQQAVEYLACYNLALWEGASDFITMFTEKLMALGIDIKVLRLRPQMERDEMHNERMFSSRVAKYTFS